MEEEKNFDGEQPDISSVQTVARDSSFGTDEIEGSPLGKFKNPQKLYDAYNELQSEFTRKCQKLSDLEKKMQTQEVPSTSEEPSCDEFAWQEKTSEFLQSHKNASELIEDITNEIIGDDDLKNSPQGLEKAYLRVMERKYKPESELAEDQEFLDKYIYSNNDIKNKFISEYISTLKQGQSPVSFNNNCYSRGVASNNEILSLEDAKKYVEDMFKY